MPRSFDLSLSQHSFLSATHITVYHAQPTNLLSTDCNPSSPLSCFPLLIPHQLSSRHYCTFNCLLCTIVPYLPWSLSFVHLVLFRSTCLTVLTLYFALVFFTVSSFFCAPSPLSLSELYRTKQIVVTLLFPLIPYVYI